MSNREFLICAAALNGLLRSADLPPIRQKEIEDLVLYCYNSLSPGTPDNQFGDAEI